MFTDGFTGIAFDILGIVRISWACCLVRVTTCECCIFDFGLAASCFSVSCNFGYWCIFLFGFAAFGFSVSCIFGYWLCRCCSCCRAYFSICCYEGQGEDQEGFA